MTQYRIVPRTIKKGIFVKDETVLVVQKLGRGMRWPGICEDIWYDCNAADITQAVLDLFCKKEK